MENLSRWLHGSSKSAYKSDPNFHLTMPDDGALRIHVQSTADWASNSLRVLVNGTETFSGTYPPDSNNFVITVPLSAGHQSVQIQNTGPDWFNITSYEFAPDNVSPLDTIGLSDSRRAYIWIYDVNSQIGQTPHGAFHNEQLIVTGLDDGSYNIEVFPTRQSTGPIDATRTESLSGTLTYTLPDFTRDIAVKVTPCIVDLEDLNALCQQWLATAPDLPWDLTGDNKVSLPDLATIAAHYRQPCPPTWPF
jgi:hypothetical protein